MFPVVRLTKIKCQSIDSNDKQEVEVWLRFAKDDDQGQLFVGANQDLVKATEAAFLQMVEAFKLLPKGSLGNVFDYAEPGVVVHKDRSIRKEGEKFQSYNPKENIFVVSLYKNDPEEKDPPKLVIKSSEYGCPYRAAIKAVCEAYAKYGIAIEYFWAGKVSSTVQRASA